jgi:hypothetical protein
LGLESGSAVGEMGSGEKVERREIMKDYILKKVSEKSESSPAVYEFTPLIKMVGEDGKEVVVRGKSTNLNEVQINHQVSMLEKELAKWKSIRAEL